MNIWETHDIKSNLRKVPLPNGGFYYVMDEFYKYPDLVVEEIKKGNAATFKIREILDDEISYNDRFFKDHRGEGMFKGLYQLNRDLGKLVKQPPINEECEDKYKLGFMYTNHATIYNHPFNELDDCYWYPHIDSGWNGIVYLNKNDSGKNGTNIYSIRRNKRRIVDRIINSHEHNYPWIPKNQLDLLDYIPSKYNSFAFYNGVKYFHGMNIGDDQYVCNMGEELEEERINQVFFLHDELAVRRNNFAATFIWKGSWFNSLPLPPILKKIVKKVATTVFTGV